MNKAEYRASRWPMRLLIAVITLMPIWFTPIRTAPLAFHASAWALIFITAVAYYIAFRETISQRTRRFFLEFFSMVVGSAISAVVLWNEITNLGDEGKLVALYFTCAVTVWFALAHRKGGNARSERNAAGGIK